MRVTYYSIRTERELDGERVAGTRIVKAADLGTELHFEAFQPGTLLRLEAEGRNGLTGRGAL